MDSKTETEFQLRAFDYTKSYSPKNRVPVWEVALFVFCLATIAFFVFALAHTHTLNLAPIN
jgi:hypothetical protein